jgi:hypothetical protein
LPDHEWQPGSERHDEMVVGVYAARLMDWFVLETNRQLRGRMALPASVFTDPFLLALARSDSMRPAMTARLANPSALTLVLPWPPTTNTYYRSVGGKVLISRAGRAYRENVAAAAENMILRRG